MLTIALGILIIIGIGTYIFLPYLADWDKERNEKPEPIEDFHEELMVQLADLEYDFYSGKLTEEDYKKLRKEIEAKLIKLERESK